MSSLQIQSRRKIAALFVLPFVVFFAFITFGAQIAAQSRGHLLVLNKNENTLAIVDPNSLQVIARVPTGEGPHEVVTSRDGRTAYVANYGTQQTQGNSISIIDLAARRETRRVDLGALRRPHGIVEAGGKIYFTVEVNRAVARLDPATGAIDWIMGTGQNGTHMLAITPDGRRIYTANIGSDTVTVIEMPTQNSPPRITHIPVGRQPEGLDLSPDGRELWVGQNGDGQISIIDTATNSVRQTIRAGQVPIRVRFTPDGRRVLVSDAQRGELIVFEAATRREVGRINIGGGVPVGVLVAPDGRRAFVAAMQAGNVVVVNLETFSIAGTIQPGRGPDGMAWGS
jgi:YVTN family beta-propeller protein